MVKPKIPLSKTPSRKQAPSSILPTQRNVIGEQYLCDAIQQKKAVKLRYQGDFSDRLYHPYIVYETDRGKVLVHGKQISNPSKPMEGPQPHKFEIGLIISIQLTDATFVVDPNFDPTRTEYVGKTQCVISRF